MKELLSYFDPSPHQLRLSAHAYIRDRPIDHSKEPIIRFIKFLNVMG